MAPLDQDDHALVAQVLAGDTAAFGVFFEGQFPALYRFALSRLGDPEATREVVQTAICHALENLASWRGEAPLAGWIFAICRHEIHRHFRRLKQEPPREELDEEISFPEGEEETPERDLDRQRLIRQVRRTLGQLPTRYGLALRWKYEEGLSVNEIAHRLALGPKAAESLLTRARLAFRQLFPLPFRKGWTP